MVEADRGRGAWNDLDCESLLERFPRFRRELRDERLHDAGALVLVNADENDCAEIMRDRPPGLAVASDQNGLRDFHPLGLGGQQACDRPRLQCGRDGERAYGLQVVGHDSLACRAVSFVAN
jgi:hypothetical protein